jgi:glycosyltransferase involved in cell wall biosynthesis
MREKDMELSIVVPVYNAEKYLRQCLDSLVALKIENYEIILVNDGSTDGSQTIMDDYTKHYPELVKCFVQKNSGVSCARNFGMSQATGTYIAFADSDDYILPEEFEALWHKVQNSGVDVAVANLQRDFDGKIVPDDLPRGKRKRLEKWVRSPVRPIWLLPITT